MKRALLFLPLLLAGCGRKDFSAKSAPGVTSVTWGVRNKLLTLDPIAANEENTASVLGEVVEGLASIDPQGRLVPRLAKSWRVDGTTLTFAMGDATFSDGTPVTAADAKASLERAGDKDLGALDTEATLRGVVGIDAPDARTLVVHLKAPDRTMVEKLCATQFAVVPARFRHTGIKRPEDLVGSGPYRMTSHVADQRTVLEANPRWRGGKPAVNRVEVLPITDPSALLNRFRAGDVDLLQVASSDVGAVLESPDLKPKTVELPKIKVVYLLMQPAAYPPMKDPRVRRALAMAIDRRKIAEDLVRGGAKASNRILPPDLAPDAPMLPPFDLAGARRLLAGAGYPDGKGLPPLTFGFHEANSRNPMVEFIPTALRELGVKVVPHPTLAFLDELHARKIPLSLSGWGAAYRDPEAVLDTLLRTKGDSNYSDYANPAFDAAEDRGRASGSLKEFEAAERIAAFDVPILPLYSQSKVWLVAPRLGGVTLSTYGPPDFTKSQVR